MRYDDREINLADETTERQHGAVIRTRSFTLSQQVEDAAPAEAGSLAEPGALRSRLFAAWAEEAVLP